MEVWFTKSQLEKYLAIVIPLGEAYYFNSFPKCTEQHEIKVFMTMETNYQDSMIHACNCCCL